MSVAEQTAPCVAVIHQVAFQRNVVTGMWRVRCSCGWADYGHEDEVKKAAASHDLWEDVK